MEIRELQPDDGPAITEVARQSLAASYGHRFDEETIDAVVTEWYSQKRLEEIHADENALVLIVDDDGPQGFVQAELLSDETVIGDVHWLHVAPEARNQGYGTQLLGEITDRMEKRGTVRIRGRVLAVNEDGADFYEHHDFTRERTRTVTIDDEEYEELLYVTEFTDQTDRIVDTIEGDDGRELVIDYTAGESGTLAPMYPTYTDDGLAEQFGWFCRNCGSTSTAMGSAGRIQCSTCENARKATRWDGSYL